MGAKLPVEVYGIKFESLQDFFKVVGYKNRTSINSINKLHGSLENFAKKRFHVDDDAKCKEMIERILKGQKNLSVEPITTDIIKIALSNFMFSTEADIKILELKRKYGDPREVETIKRDVFNEFLSL